MRLFSRLALLGSTLVLGATTPVAAQTTVSVTVPGTSDPWLAGMPAGSTASNGDVAPTHSPVLVGGLSFAPGDIFTFLATGSVGHGPGLNAPNPDGAAVTNHAAGAQNGISDVSAPINALVGLFLDASQPSLTAAPGALDFGSAASRDYLSLSPLLKQVFFIGDGRTSASAVQQVVAPAGATRLYLGTMDGFGWFNNVGTIEVAVTVNSAGTPSVVPEPSVVALTATGLLAVAGVTWRRRRLAT